jgi:hypothetical protein
MSHEPASISETRSASEPGSACGSPWTCEPRSASGPPSAAGDFAPYGARIFLRPTAEGLEPEPFLVALLEVIASACVDAGASVIGHLKCFLRTPDGHVACNLTSVRSGAKCRESGAGVVAPGGEAELDLAVLVYGLPVGTIDGLVGEALEELLPPLGVRWTKSGSFPA